MTSTTVKDIEAITNSREKLKRNGSATSLKLEEILYILLGINKRSTNVLNTAKSLTLEIEKLLKQHIIEKGSIHTDEFCIKDFENISGVSTIKAHLIIAAIELGKRITEYKDQTILNSTPKEVWQSLPEIRNAEKEHFITILLDSRGREIGRDIVSIGTVGASLVHPREVFKKAIKMNAVSIIGVHNHPSNKTDPSTADIIITERLVKVGQLIDIEFEDHIIISKDSFYSLREEMPNIFY